MHINNRFSVRRDRYCWILSEWIDGLTRKELPKKSERKTFHANLKQVADAMVDRTMGEADSLQAIIPTVEKLRDEIAAMLEEAATRG